MANNIDLKMLLSLKDNASKSLDKFNKKLDATQKKIDKSNSGFSKLAGGLTKLLGPLGKVAAVASAVGIGLFVATNKALEFADAIGKAAQVAGVSAETLQELQYAFEIFGITEQQTSEGLRRFTRRLGEFVNSGGGPAKKAIEDLGLAVKDSEGNFLGTEAVLVQVMDKMKDMETQAERSAFAAQLFGDDAGPKLALALGQGSVAIDALRTKARNLGIIIDDDLIANAEKMNDEWTTAAKIIKIQVIKAFLQLAPVISNVVNKLIELTPQISLLMEQAFGVPIENRTLTSLEIMESRITDSITAYQIRIKKLSREPVRDWMRDATGLKGGGTDTLTQERIKLENELKLVQNAIAKRIKEQDEAEAALKARIAGGVIEVPTATTKTNDDLVKSLESLRKQLDANYANVQKYESAMQLLDKAYANKLISENQYNDLMIRVAANTDEAKQSEEERLALLQEGQQVIAANRTEQEKLSDELVRLDMLLEEGVINFEQYSRAVTNAYEEIESKTKDTANEMTIFFEQAFRNMQGAAADFFEGFMTQKFDNFKDGMKQLAVDFSAVIRRMVAEWLAAKVLTAGFGAAGFTGDNFRADGGPVSANEPYIVGERGPELFVPTISGDIIPNGESMSGGNTVAISISAMDGQDVMRTLEGQKRFIAELVNGTNRTYNLGGA